MVRSLSSMPDRAFSARLTEGPVVGTLVSLALPMVWGLFSVISFNLVDTYFVGQLGLRELAALSFTFPVVMALGSLAIGLGVGASSLISRAIGEGDRHKVRQLTTNSLILALLIVGVFVVAGLLTIDPLFTALGAGPETLPLIRKYIRIWYLGMVFVVVPMVGNGAIRAAGDTKFPSLIMTIAAVVNVVLDPILIFGLLGFPRLELEGAAIATLIARAATLVAALWVLHYREGMLLLSRQRLGDIVRSWKEILAIALPAAAAGLVAPVAMGIIVRFVARFGTEAVAAFGVVTRIEAFTMIVTIALSASIGPFVGQNWGAGRKDRVREALRKSMGFCLAWGVIVAGALALIGGKVAALFNPDPRVVEVACLYLLIVPLSYGMEGIIHMVRMALNALGQAFRATALIGARYLLLYVPLAYAASLSFGLRGIFVAAALSNFVVAFAAYLLCRRIGEERGGEYVPEDRPQEVV